MRWEGCHTVRRCNAEQSSDSPSCRRRAPLTWTSKLPYLKVSDNIQVARVNQARICKVGPALEEMRMTQEPTYVGIDVSKDQVDVAVRPTGRELEYAV